MKLQELKQDQIQYWRMWFQPRNVGGVLKTFLNRKLVYERLLLVNWKYDSWLEAIKVWQVQTPGDPLNSSSTLSRQGCQ